MNIIYTTADQMYRVIEKNGAFYPEECRSHCPAYSNARLTDASLIEALVKNNWTVYTDWYGYFLGYDCRGKCKGNKNFKTAKAAIAFVERCSANLQADE